LNKVAKTFNETFVKLRKHALKVQNIFFLKVKNLPARQLSQFG